MKRLALVAGGCAGIGLGVASALAADHDLALSYASNHERAEVARKMLERDFPETEVRTYGGRLKNFANAAALVSAIKRDFGRAPSVLVNSIGGLHDALFLDSDFECHERLIHEHLIVTMALCRLVLREMCREGFGRIVNLGSIAAHYAKPGQCSYAAAKAGIEGFSRVIALEVAHRGITINVVAPGLIDTPLTAGFIRRGDEAGRWINGRIPAGRLGNAAEVGALVRFLCSQQAGYITGTVLTIDGGRSLGDAGLCKASAQS